VTSTPPADPAALVPLPAAEAEVVDLARDLLRLDTSNYGDGTGPGEAEAAEYVQARLAEVGLDAERFVTTGGRREGVVVRIPGRDRSRGALLLHGHLDVVPARGDDWSVPPFAGEVVDDLLWGRGAVDMKDADAMMLAVVRAWARDGVQPDRDVVLLFLPDEEAGGVHGSHWLVEHRPDIFEGVTEAVGEVGGFSLTVRDDLRLYLVQTAEKGINWMRLRAAGRAGHGSMLNDDNAVTALCEAVARVGQHRFPLVITPTVRDFVAELGDALGVELSTDDEEALLAQLGPLAGLVGATLRDTANPTMLEAGYKVNVIPGEASAHVDGRFLPGHEEESSPSSTRRWGGARRPREHIADIAVETTFDGASIDHGAAGRRTSADGAVHAVGGNDEGLQPRDPLLRLRAARCRPR
jgi:acetylornithine deacetylase/succinyl-diaminopimelate desuccinylase-like protein